jgi:GNAT superfamily N-acetyltransferase
VSRNPVHVRDAKPGDAAALLGIWADFSPRSHSEQRPTLEPPEVEAAVAVARIAADPDQRLLVGVLDGAVVAAVHLVRAPMSPLSTEQAVHITHLHVLTAHRRHGLGHALVEATVRWAEEKDTSHVLAAASVHSRDANRFMARLGLAQIAVLRRATVAGLRAKLPVEPPAAARVGSRTDRAVGQVLARRRSLRRAQEKSCR